MVLFLVELMPSFSLVLLNLNLQEQLCPFWRMSLEFVVGREISRVLAFGSPHSDFGKNSATDPLLRLS